VLGALCERGDEVTVVTRRPEGRPPLEGVEYAKWLPELGPFDAIVHLAGENIFAGRWNPVQKGIVRASRIDSTRKIVAALRETAACGVPKTFVCASAVGIYGDRGDELLTESSSPGSDFLAEVCVEWEREAQLAREHGARVVNIRIGIVLGPEGGMLEQLLLPFKLCVGGPIGRGRQQMSWIHVGDLARLILFALDTPELEGPVNATAPEVATNAEFTRALARALHRPAFLPIPPFALRVAFGEVAEVMTGSQRCVPERALSAGFTFEHPEIGAALRDLL
jgi:uncharacterized protein (TIGR01777 family)